MSNEPNDTTFVDPNTDDLDAFSDLFGGKAQVKDEETVEPVEVEPVSEDEDVSGGEQEDVEDEAPDGDDDSDTKPVEKPKKVSRVQERINELTARAREAERALEALKIAQHKQDEPDKTLSITVPDTGPDPDARNEDGSDKYPLGLYDPQYIRDMARHTIDTGWAKKEQEAAENLQRQQLEQARADIQNQWAERLTPVLEQHEDFLEKTLGLESAFDGLEPQYSDYLVQTIKSLEHGPDVLYYFANNLDEAQKFVKLGPLNATLALGEINAMFKGQTRKSDPKVSKAPPPPQVNKGSKTRVAVSPDTDNLDDFASIFWPKKER